MSFWKRDLAEVNGFDEQYMGWGREDSDIALRLLNAGVSKLKLKFAAIQYHIYHPGQNRKNLKKNETLLNDCIKQKRIRAIDGLDSY